MHAPSSASSTPTGNFSDRIALLIQRVGSATQIARMCGFSEGVVRSWRDGHTDPSRARCVTLARTLGISLIWLVAGEGGMQADPGANIGNDHRRTNTPSAPCTALHADRTQATATTQGVDTKRLSIAMRLLQSELELSGSGLGLAENTDLLSELYAIIGPSGTHADADAIAAFNHRLAQHIQHERGTV